MAEIQTTTWSETAASNNAATPDGWPENQSYASVNDCAREMMAALKRWWNRDHATLSSGGTSTAYTLTYTTAPPAYTQGMQFTFRVSTTSGAGTTLNVNAVGAKAIQKQTSAGLAALVANDLIAGQLAKVQYDSTADAFILLSPTPQTMGNITAGTATITTANVTTGTVGTLTATTATLSTTDIGAGAGTSLTLTGGRFAITAVSLAGSVIDLTTGNYFFKTATTGLTWTFQNPLASKGQGFILELTNGGVGTQTWPSSVKWPSGTAPTLTTSGVDVLVFTTRDGGTTWRGMLSQKDSR